MRIARTAPALKQNLLGIAILDGRLLDVVLIVDAIMPQRMAKAQSIWTLSVIRLLLGMLAQIVNGESDWMSIGAGRLRTRFHFDF